MADSPLAAHGASPAELKERLELERRGKPFLVYRDGAGEQRLHVLPGQDVRLTVGRAEENDIALDWDREVSRIHAELERLSGHWTVADEGLSTNGTFVNGVRIGGRRRLRDRDVLRFGSTTVAFCAADRRESRTTLGTGDLIAIPKLSEAQRNVLLSLCRPVKRSSGFATPATNQEIAKELFLSVDTVKTHLRALFQKFAIEDLPQNQKRLRLVELAFQSGFVADHDPE